LGTCRKFSIIQTRDGSLVVGGAENVMRDPSGWTLIDSK
jgi:hypothetical protein